MRNDTLGLPTTPFFVEIRMTPFAPRIPYTAVAEASLRMENDAISSVLIRFMSRSTPSTRTSGDEFTHEPMPRIRIVAPSYPGSPLLWRVMIPGMAPPNELESDGAADCSRSLTSTCVREPVIVAFF